MKLENNPPLMLYVHIPFCVKKCAYCDFLSGPADLKTQESYIRALCLEMRENSGKLRGRPVTSVFIGGGTPSILPPALMEELLKELNRTFSLSGNVEFTIEANPGTLDQEKLQVYRQYGVNRLSLGLQSTFSDDLKMLGRIHSFEDFLKSFSLAREAGFTNINVDLMSAIPRQTKARWQENLRRVAELGPEHISAYSLIVEEGTPFYEQELDLPDEDTEYEMYEDTRRVLAGYGYEQYEISNYARQGAACRHNIGYWQRRDYLGMGLGAASLIDGRRFSNTCRMEEYLAGSGDPETLRREVQMLSAREAMEEFMFLGLRMTEGVSEEKFRQQFHRELKEVYGDVLLRYETSGHLIHEGDTYRFSSEGIHVSNWILSDFLSD